MWLLDPMDLKRSVWCKRGARLSSLVDCYPGNAVSSERGLSQPEHSYGNIHDFIFA